MTKDISSGNIIFWNPTTGESFSRDNVKSSLTNIDILVSSDVSNHCNSDRYS